MSGTTRQPADVEPIATPPVEPERYELEERPARAFALDRREVFRVLGGGVAVALLLGGDSQAQESGRASRRGELRVTSPSGCTSTRPAPSPSIPARSR